MSANIEFRNGKLSFAFPAGERGQIWHSGGQEYQHDWPRDQKLAAANMLYTTTKIPAYRLIDGRPQQVPNAHFITRSDTSELLSDRSCSDQYQPHQNADLYDTVNQYAELDPEHWHLAGLGALGNGARVFFTVQFNGDHTVAGEPHKFYLLASTTHDGTGASIYQGTTVRVVCSNTFGAATADPKGKIRVVHRSAFNKDRASAELAAIIQSFKAYKAVGDAMVRVQFGKDEVSKLFKTLLEIPFEAKPEDISTRKMNQFTALSDAYSATIREGTDRNTVWTALQAVTRYVDHDRSTRGGDAIEKRFESAQFGSGAALKAQAFDLLLPLVRDKVAA